MQVSVSVALVPSHSMVDTEWERTHYWKALMLAWGVKGRKASSDTFFPGANPCSVSRKTLPPKDVPHVLALKSDGVRYALFLTTRPGGTASNAGGPVALMIDRARNMYEVEVLAPEDYFVKQTILEGELVWQQPNERTLLYLVFDAVRIAGESFLEKPFVDRLAAATRCTRWSEELAPLPDVETRVSETGCVVLVHFDPPVVMRPKRFVDRAHAVRVWSERNDAEHRVDGLVVHRADASYVHGTATGAVYKWKPRHTVDLAGPDLRAADGPLDVGGRPVRVLESRVTATKDDEVAEYLLEVVKENDATDEGNKRRRREVVTLFAMRTRPDKRVPNGLRVIQATVQDAIEQLTPEDLA